MSNLVHDITQQVGAHKKLMRVGRGEGSKGKTSGRGMKGAGSRAGASQRIGFEGGQTEIYRRFPQRGFSNKPFETKYHVVNVAALERFDEGATIDQATLKEAGLIPNTRLGVKILGDGQLSKKLIVVVAAYSRSAHQVINAQGGTTQNTLGQPFEFGEPRTKRLKRKLDKRLLGLGLEAHQPPDETGETDSSDKAASAKPTGENGPVTQAPEESARPAGESGTSDKAASSKPTGEDGPVTEAPESGEKL